MVGMGSCGPGGKERRREGGVKGGGRVGCGGHQLILNPLPRALHDTRCKFLHVGRGVAWGSYKCQARCER